MQDNFYIPKRFEKAIALHIIKNQFDSSFRTPLLLGIHGKPEMERLSNVNIFYNN